MIRVGIVDDNSINIKTVKQKLGSFSEITISLEASNGKDFIDKMHDTPDNVKPNVVLMDLDMPLMDGIEAVKIGSVLFSQTRFIILTVFEDTDRIFEAIKAGASGYLLKDDKAINIIDSITNVVEFNGMPMSPVIARKVMDMMLGNQQQQKATISIEQYGLTNRETEILKELASGATYNAIGEKLFISPLTVRKHVANLYEKLQVSTRVQIVNIAQQNKLI